MENHGVDPLQRPLLLLSGDGQDFIRNAAYRGVKDLYPIGIPDTCLNGGHAFGIHGQNLLLNVPAAAGQVFLQQLGALPVPGNRHLHIAKTGAQRLAAVTVPAVVCGLVLVVILAVAKLFIQLSFQAILRKLGNGLLEQILDGIHAADVCHLQQLTDLLSTGAFSSGGRFFLAIYKISCMVLCGASILHHAGGLHKVWDSLGRGQSPILCKLHFGRK